jgi:chromosome segregation ATPase
MIGKFKLWMGLVSVVVFGLAAAPTVFAQKKIVCWKDASGKVVGCGDKVPLEYANNSTKELDKDGNTRKTGESVDEAAKRKAREQEQAQAKADDQKRMAEQRRQDTALINTFSNEKEIDLKRDREIQAIDNNVTQQRAALKVANERLADAQQRAAAFEKSNKDKKPLSPVIKDDLARAEGEKVRLEKDITAKEKSKQDTETTYAAYKKRYQELKGTVPAPTAATPVPATAASAAPAAAKK